MHPLRNRLKSAFLLSSLLILFLSANLTQSFKTEIDQHPELIQEHPDIPNGAIQATNVCISEIYAFGDANEWFEFYNPTGGDVDLTGWRALDPSTGGEIIELGGNISAYHGGNPNIYAGEIISIGDQGSGADIEMLVDNNITMAYTDELAIIDNGGNYQDVVCFGLSVIASMQNTWFWNTANPAPDLTGLSSSSIERINRTLGSGQLEDNNIETDWELISPTTRGSLPQYILPIVISEVMYGGEGMEWVEITNNGLKSYDIGTWILHSLGEDNQTQIPAGTILAPYNTYVVGEPVAFVDLQRNITLKDAGDVLHLKNGSLIVDTVIWGSGNNTFTLGMVNGWTGPNNATGGLTESQSIFRYNLTRTLLSDTNSTIDWYVMDIPTPGDFYNISVGDVLLSEITTSGTTTEFIELYNNLSWPITLESMEIWDYGAGSREIQFSGNVVISAHGVLTAGDSASGSNYTDSIDLATGAEDLVLYSDGTRTYELDVVIYGNDPSGNTYPWGAGTGWIGPENATGGLSAGYSLQRINGSSHLLIDTNRSTDWTASVITPGWTLPFSQNLDRLVFSEVMYGGSGGEWIELVNSLNSQVDLDGCTLKVYSSGNTTLFPLGTYIAPYSTFVITDLLLADVGDILLLQNQSGTIIDVVSWGTGNKTFVLGTESGWSSTINATGNLPAGQSIFRYNLTRTLLADSNSSADWYMTDTPTPGSFYTLNIGDVFFSEISMAGDSAEFIELYNNLSWPILIDSMEIWDYGADSREIQFSGSVIISPYGVLTAGDSGSGPDYIDTIDLTGGAEDLVLYRDGTKTYELDVIIYGNDPVGNTYSGTGWIGPDNATGGLSTGYSLQRINGSDYLLLDTNTATDWEVGLATPGWISPYSSPGMTGSIIITEIMTIPFTPTNGSEYIELYNPLDISVAIGKWQIFSESTWGGAPKISIPAGMTIPAKTHFCITDNYSRCVERYNLNGFYYQSPDFSLDDGPGDAILTDAYDNIIDFVAWRSSTTDYTNTIDPIAWTDGGVYKGSTGKALARLYNPALNDAYLDTNSSADWRYSVYPAPGNHTNNTLFLSTPFTGSAQVRTFSSPDNSYAAVVDLWRAAKNTLDVCVYQFTSDSLLQELVATMNRGVQVRLLLQDIYPLYDSPYIFDSTHDSDNYQTVYVATQVDNNPNGSVRWASDYFAYTHAKYFIIDGEVVAMLTENFKTTGVPSNPTYGNRGWGIAINNSQLAQKYLQVYNFDWNIAQVFNPGILITGQRDTFIPTGMYQSVGNYQTFEVTAQFQTVVAFDDPINVIVSLLDSATKCVYIELFYLYPTWTGSPGGQNNNPFLQALIRAAERGVDVRVILDSTEYNLDGENNNDEAAQVLQAHNVKVKWSNNSGGIEKFHVKALIVDNASVMIASINWNENSATNNREIGVIVNSTLVAQYYLDLFFYDWVSLSTTSAPGEGDEGPEPTYTWMWWLPVVFLVYVVVLLFGYVRRHAVESTRVRNIPHVFSPSLKESVKPTSKAETAPIPIEPAILRLKIQEIYGSAITVTQLKPYGTSTGENAPGTFIRSYVRANHEFLQVGAVVNPIPRALIFKYSPEDYIGIESTLDLRPRAFEIKSLLTGAVRETVRLDRIKTRIDNMLREGI